MSLERYTADQAKISYAPEDSYGTKPTSVDRFLAATNLDIDTSRDNAVIQTADGTRTPHTVVYGVEETGGSIPGTMLDGRLFTWMLGDPNTTSSSETDNDNLHTYDNSVTKFDPLSFTIQVDLDHPNTLDDLNRHIFGCVASSLEISIPEGAGAIEYTLDYDAQDDTAVASGSVDSVESFSDREPMLVDETTYSVNGSQRTDILEATINIETSNEQYRTTRSTDSHKPVLISPGSLEFSVDFEVLFEDTFWRDKMKNGEKLDSITIDIDKDDGSRQDHIIITLEDITVDDAPYNIPEEGDIQDTVTLSAETLKVEVHDDFTH